MIGRGILFGWKLYKKWIAGTTKKDE